MSKDTEETSTTTEKEKPKASGAVRTKGSPKGGDVPSTTSPATAAADADDKSRDGKDEDAEKARTPEEIKEDIKATREEMGDTVEALAEKSDVKGQAKARIGDVKEKVQQKREEYTAKAKDTTPESAQESGKAAWARVQDNPTPFIVGAAVLVGYLLGRRG